MARKYDYTVKLHVQCNQNNNANAQAIIADEV